MTSDEIAVETRDQGGGPVVMTQQEIVLRHVPNMSGHLQIGFTPNGPVDIPTDLQDVAWQLEQLTANTSAPVDSDDYVTLTHVALDAQTWHDMGEPDTITVAIRPGDQLNQEHGLADLGPVSEVQHIPGKGDPVAVVRHRPVEGDQRPQHDDAEPEDVREIVREVVDPMAPLQVTPVENRSV